MKNSYITFAVFSMAALLVSCQTNELVDNDMYIPEEGDVVFAMPSRVATKASDTNVTTKGVRVDLGTVDGRILFLEETITNLDAVAYAPETKGTPAYTENLGVLYADNLGVHADAGSFGEFTYENVESSMVNGGTNFGWGWRFMHKYATDPWPASGSVGFYLRMPSDMEGVTTDLTKAAPYSNGSITFNYTSPSTAAEMQDILFGYRSVAKDDYKGFLPNGIPVLLRHALTGVKFAIANYSEEENITIKSVTFKGLYDSAECTITPVQGTEANNPDNISEYTSAAAVNWKLAAASRSQTAYSSGTFGAPVNFSGSTTETVDGEEVKTNGSFTDNGEYPDSFAAAGNTNNLNDSNATQTFWLIPQTMTSDIKLVITYTFGKDGENDITRTETLEFGRILAEKNVVWHAGELHTYTIRLDEVNVMIEDDVVAQNPGTQYKDSYKNNVVITNSGNTDTYIRAAIIGQWLNSEGNPVFGFTDFTASAAEDQYKLVESWYQDQFGTGTDQGRHIHGAFKNLVGYKNDNAEGKPGDTVYTSDWWIKGPDGYYYFKYVVPAGMPIPAGESGVKYISVGTDHKGVELTSNASDPLFESYTVKDAPDARVAGDLQEVIFELEIATQAISAKRPDGSYYTLSEAWAKAGITITE